MSDKSSLAIRDIKQHAHNAGSLITIQGSGLLGVSYVSLGGLEVKFSTDSDDRLFIEVPEEFRSGLVELRTASVVGLSNQPITLSGLAHSAPTH
ncbi:IPT/TIG domain-containing protein [Chitinimonas sp. PSY-7]|uniref:IPT/TIG domain-containing protein n=1 Tax=Chitinimonas sp. PSY-7 TaxID=3459088 RepID=UPI00404002CB